MRGLLRIFAYAQARAFRVFRRLAGRSTAVMHYRWEVSKSEALILELVLGGCPQQDREFVETAGYRWGFESHHLQHGKYFGPKAQSLCRALVMSTVAWQAHVGPGLFTSAYQLPSLFQVVSADSEGFVKTWDLGTYQPSPKWFGFRVPPPLTYQKTCTT